MTVWQTVLCWVGGLVVASWAGIVALAVAARTADRRRARLRSEARRGEVLDLEELLARRAVHDR